MPFADILEGLPIERLATFGEPTAFAGSAFVACIPARDEEDWITRCLTALDAELHAGDGVVLVANDCADATAAVAQGIMAGWSRPFLIAEGRWRAGEGSAPLARRLAFDLAHRFAPEAVLFSTDADTIVQRGLRAAYAAEFAKGFDLVCGRIAFLPQEAALLPAADPRSEAVIAEYREISRHIAALLRPDPDNSYPHHGNIGGANFAVRADAYRVAGPLPTPPSGEDRALRRRFEAHGLRIRYCDEPTVETSCRLDGRAKGGLSDELSRNRREADPQVDELLEPPDRLLRRCRARAAFLGAGRAHVRSRIARSLGLPHADGERLGRSGGPLAWSEVEDLSPMLERERIRLSDLVRHLPALRRARDSIR